MSKRTVLIGGIFTPSQTAFIAENSIGVMQNAADAFQKGVIAGMAELEGDRFSVVNVPFISAYPTSFKKLFFPAATDRIGGCRIDGMAFNNISLWRFFSRCRAAFWGLIRSGIGRGDAVMVYSAHTPFMIAALLYARLRRIEDLLIIIPDFPEFMGTGGLAHKLFGGLNGKLFYALSRRFRYFVVLTEAMHERLGVDPAHAIVIEGIAASGRPGGDALTSDAEAARATAEPGAERVILYTGTLALRYGIRELVDGFMAFPDPTARLWICGEGEGRTYVEACAQRDPRIVYHGQVSREQATQLQTRAQFLINPREGNDEYVKFSFPSKIMEYMNSGTPVIMFHLSGIPGAYRGKFIEIEGAGAPAIANALQRGFAMSEGERLALGKAAQDFVRDEKNPVAQASRVLQLLGR